MDPGGPYLNPKATFIMGYDFPIPIWDHWRSAAFKRLDFLIPLIRFPFSIWHSDGCCIITTTTA
jgi:hypothetical protein